MRLSRPRGLLSTATAVAAVVGMATLAGCGSSAPPKPVAGHGTPGGAATGFLQAASDNKATEACSYVAPPQLSVCTQALTAGSTISVKNLHLGATTVSGTQALVTALGTLCTDSDSKVCFTSSNPRAGQPTGTQTFAEAYSAVESGSSSNNDPAIPCTQVQGRWYVDLGQSSASGTGSTTTTTTG